MQKGPQKIGFDDLCPYFSLPISEVSKKLGICATVLKKICRRNGIKRWPHRKFKSLERMIKALENTVPSCPEEQKRIAKQLEEMKTKKSNLLCYKSTTTAEPDHLGSCFVTNTIQSEITTPATTSEERTPISRQEDIVSTVSELVTNLKARRMDSVPSVYAAAVAGPLSFQTHSGSNSWMMPADHNLILPPLVNNVGSTATLPVLEPPVGLDWKVVL